MNETPSQSEKFESPDYPGYEIIEGIDQGIIRDAWNRIISTSTEHGLIITGSFSEYLCVKDDEPIDNKHYLITVNTLLQPGESGCNPNRLINEFCIVRRDDGRFFVAQDVASFNGIGSFPPLGKSTVELMLYDIAGKCAKTEETPQAEKGAEDVVEEVRGEISTVNKFIKEWGEKLKGTCIEIMDGIDQEKMKDTWEYLERANEEEGSDDEDMKTGPEIGVVAMEGRHYDCQKNVLKRISVSHYRIGMPEATLFLPGKSNNLMSHPSHAACYLFRLEDGKFVAAHHNTDSLEPHPSEYAYVRLTNEDINFILNDVSENISEKDQEGDAADKA
jgi:hypothetical protein